MHISKLLTNPRFNVWQRMVHFVVQIPELSFVWAVTARISKVLTNQRFDLLQQIDRVLLFLWCSSSSRLPKPKHPTQERRGIASNKMVHFDAEVERQTATGRERARERETRKHKIYG